MQPEDPIVQALREAAIQALQNSYSPYSHFPVGAAVLAENGEVFAACNVENASFGLTICAERNAVFHAVAKGHRKIRAVVVVTLTDQPTPPCGACRQVINEFASDAEVFSFGKGGSVAHAGLRQLLPDAFGRGGLLEGSASGKKED
jgi:cytidine deaminase